MVGEEVSSAVRLNLAGHRLVGEWPIWSCVVRAVHVGLWPQPVRRFFFHLVLIDEQATTNRTVLLHHSITREVCWRVVGKAR